MKNRRIIGGAAIGAVLLIFLASTCKYADPGAVGSPPEDPDDGGTVTSTIRVTSVSLDKEMPVGIYELGDTDDLIAAIEPENATNRAVTWTSSNSEVAMITSEEGSPLCTFECVGKGIATITVTTWDGDKKASYSVMVQAGSTDPNKKYPTGFTGYLMGGMSELSEYAMRLGETYMIGPTDARLADPTGQFLGGVFMSGGHLLPLNDSTIDRTCYRTSSDEGVFIIAYDGAGVYTGIQAVGAGRATFSLITANGLSQTVDIIVVEPMKIEMVKIDFGSFTMGNPGAELGSNEWPAHTVNVGSFMMSKYPITQEQWESVMGTNPSDIKGAKLPVTNVSLIEAMDFCFTLNSSEGRDNPFSFFISALDAGQTIVRRYERKFTADGPQSPMRYNGYRLPTEAEWEFACRAGYSTPYSIGNGTSINGNHANFEESGIFEPTPVGKYAPNKWGLYDMNGNVSEWCYSRGYDYTEGVKTDPGLSNLSFTSSTITSNDPGGIRGGSCADSADKLRSAWRGTADSHSGNLTIGFRVVRAVGPED